MLDVGLWMSDVGLWISAVGCRMSDKGLEYTGYPNPRRGLTWTSFGLNLKREK
jgi:hypothetical protein